MRHQENVFIHDDKINALARIPRLIRVVCNPPKIPLGQMKYDLFERDIALFLESLILLWIPLEFHALLYIECMHTTSPTFCMKMPMDPKQVHGHDTLKWRKRYTVQGLRYSRVSHSALPPLRASFICFGFHPMVVWL